MKVLPEPLSFDWDKGNIDKNFRKHKIANRESEEVFQNRPFYIHIDQKHSTQSEKRYDGLGKTGEGKVLFITFTIRGEKVRIISARTASRKERSVYEKKKTKTNS